MAARLTPDQKIGCLNHLEVRPFFSPNFTFHSLRMIARLIPLGETGRDSQTVRSKKLRNFLWWSFRQTCDDLLFLKISNSIALRQSLEKCDSTWLGSNQGLCVAMVAAFVFRSEGCVFESRRGQSVSSSASLSFHSLCMIARLIPLGVTGREPNSQSKKSMQTFVVNLGQPCDDLWFPNFSNSIALRQWLEKCDSTLLLF